MKNYTKYIIDYTEGNLSEHDRNKFEAELILNSNLKNEYDLFMSVNEIMQGKIDVDNVNADPDLKRIDELSNQLITDFKSESTKYKFIQSFVENSLVNDEERNLQNEINRLNMEIDENNINEITQEWVNDWNNKKHSIKDIEIKNFVETSLHNKNSNYTKNSTKHEILWYKTPLTKIITLSAVATLALFFVVRTILIPVSPDSLFELNYQPYQAFTAVTRGDENSFSNRYNYAIINYNQGNYELAAIEFELMMKNDTFKVAPFFFAGLSQIELGNYSKAIDLLAKVTTLNADYTIEAKWYLGLIYLKNGDMDQAEICFKDLSSIPGYYQEKSRKLLRKLQK